MIVSNIAPGSSSLDQVSHGVLPCDPGECRVCRKSCDFCRTEHLYESDCVIHSGLLGIIVFICRKRGRRGLMNGSVLGVNDVICRKICSLHIKMGEEGLMIGSILGVND